MAYYYSGHSNPLYKGHLVTRFVPNKTFNSKRVQKAIHSRLSAIKDDVEAVALQSAYNTLNKLAPKLVYSIAQGRGFNSFTGALAYAYGASLTLDGKHVGNYVMDDGALLSVTPPPLTIRFSRSGRAYARMQPGRKHKNAPLYKRKNYALKKRHKRGRKTGYNLFPTTRYLKSYESLTGYNKGLFKRNLSAAANFVPYKRRQGSKKERLFNLQIFNVAPYAAMVDARGYNVIEGGSIRGRARNLRSIVAYATTEQIKRALHNYKKDYSKSQTGRADVTYGKIYRAGNESYD